MSTVEIHADTNAGWCPMVLQLELCRDPTKGVYVLCMEFQSVEWKVPRLPCLSICHAQLRQ